MFSYRHSFHAGNHGDVIKHVCLIAALRHLMRKPGPLLLVDTHAGAGRYDLGGAQATKSGEARVGVFRLRAALQASGVGGDLLDPYLALLQAFNRGGDDAWRIYPGSPAIMHALMSDPTRATAEDRLHLFEWHPTVYGLLAEEVARWSEVRRVLIRQADGLVALKGQLPPPPAATGPRRAFVLIDPPYELKTDYGAVERALADALKRFATGVYMVWYPVVAQPGSQRLPRRLEALATQAGRDWLHATLDVGRPLHGGQAGMTASGVFMINPPYTLADGLRADLPRVASALSRGGGERWQVVAHES